MTSAWALVATAVVSVISLGRLPEFRHPVQAFSIGPERPAPLGEPPSILFGPVLEIAGQAEMLGGVERPERIEQDLAGKEDQVCTIILQNLLGEFRRPDHPDGAGWNAGFAADLFGKRHL